MCGEMVAAGRQGIVVDVADLVDVGAVVAQACDLRGCRSGRNEDVGGMPEPAGSPRDGCTMVAARRGDEAFVGDVLGAHVMRRPAGLERTTVLEVLELEHQCRVDADLVTRHGEDRGVANERVDHRCCGFDVCGRDR